MSTVRARDPAVRTSELHSIGLRTRVLEAGASEDQEAVVLLHGGPGSADDWRALLPELAAFARAVAFDLPGWGQADKPTTWSYSPEAYAAFLAGALHELGIRRAHLVMGDIGAGGGLIWAAAHPEAFASAIMLDAGVLIDFRWHAAGRLHRLPLIGDIAARLGRISFVPIIRFYEPKLDKRYVRTWRSEFDWGTRRALLRFWRAEQAEGRGAERIAPALRSLDRPALVIWGAKDRLAPAKQAERQRDSFPSAEIVVIEGSYHYPLLDAPERTSEAIVSFLRQHVA